MYAGYVTEMVLLVWHAMVLQIREPQKIYVVSVEEIIRHVAVLLEIVTTRDCVILPMEESATVILVGLESSALQRQIYVNGKVVITEVLVLLSQENANAFKDIWEIDASIELVRITEFRI